MVTIEEEIVKVVEEAPAMEAMPGVGMEEPLEESPVSVKEPVKVKEDSKMQKETQKKTKNKKPKHAGMFSLKVVDRLTPFVIVGQSC